MAEQVKITPCLFTKLHLPWMVQNNPLQLWRTVDHLEAVSWGRSAMCCFLFFVDPCIWRRYIWRMSAYFSVCLFSYHICFHCFIYSCYFGLNMNYWEYTLFLTNPNDAADFTFDTDHCTGDCQATTIVCVVSSFAFLLNILPFYMQECGMS